MRQPIPRSGTGPLKVGDRVQIVPEWQDPGDDKYERFVIEAPDDCTRVRIQAVLPGLFFQHVEWIQAGFKPLTDGSGFKAGAYGVEPDTKFPDPPPRHRVINCLAVRNRSSGFYANHHPGGSEWIHNTAYFNPTNFNFLGRNTAGAADIPGRDHKIINNLSYRSNHGVRNLDEAGNNLLGNQFVQEKTLKSEDFEDLDESRLTAPRKSNGDLPEIRFMRLKKLNTGGNTPGMITRYHQITASP